jgi:hypothetical protein
MVALALNSLRPVLPESPALTFEASEAFKPASVEIFTALLVARAASKLSRTLSSKASLLSDDLRDALDGADDEDTATVPTV